MTGRCSVISDLRVITFDGNNVALYDNGSYILVHLPRENIVGHIEKCPTSVVRLDSKADFLNFYMVNESFRRPCCFSLNSSVFYIPCVTLVVLHNSICTGSPWVQYSTICTYFLILYY